MSPDDAIHASWRAVAHEDDGNPALHLQLAVERVPGRGFNSYACIDCGEDDEVILASVQFAATGLDAFTALREKLHAERGLTLDETRPPDLLLEPEWQSPRIGAKQEAGIERR